MWVAEREEIAPRLKEFDVINHTVEMKDARGLGRAVRHIFIGLVCAACVPLIILSVARSLVPFERGPIPWKGSYKTKVP